MLGPGVGDPGVVDADESRGDVRSGVQARALSVVRVDGVFALESFATEIDRLNAASARPSPFSSSAYLHCYALRNEYYTPGHGECLFVVRDATRVAGCVPMRRTVERWGPSVGPLALGGVRLAFLALHDNEQPHILCAPEDEERVTAALIAHICQHERGWGMVEFAGQPPGGALYRCAHAVSDARFRVRDIPVEPYTEIALTWPDLYSYFRSLIKHMRSNISRQARRLYAAGEVELVLARGTGGVAAWFDSYCDLDARSWKSGTRSSIQRHPRRVRFFRELVAGRAGIDPSFIGVVLDGVLVAGLIVSADAARRREPHGSWCMEMAYDRTRSDLGPGQLLLLLAVGEAIDRGHAFLNFMQCFAYYKHRWGAEPIEVVNLQIIRRRSMHNMRASAGDIKRRWQARRAGAAGEAAEAGARQDRGEVDPAVEPRAAAVDQERARLLTAAALRYSGAEVRRLDRSAASAWLPFPLEVKDR